MRRSILGILPGILFSLTALPAYPSALGEAAAGMKPGEWAAFDSKSWSLSLITTGVDNILNYSSTGVWDPIAKEVRFVGQGHYEAEKMIIYDDATDTWSNATPPVGTGIGHGYDHNAIDARTGISYYRKYYSTGVYAYQDRKWSALPSLPGSEGDYACCGALVYSGDFGGLTFWGGGSIYAFRENAWTTLKTGLAMGPYHNVAEYSKPYGVIIGGGGNDSKALYALDAKGGVDTLPEAPTGIGVNQGLMVADPVTGELLAIGGTGDFYAYHPGKKTWSPLAKPPARYLETEGSSIQMTVAIPIETYGVIMFLHRNGINLYKHAATGPISLRPDPGRLVPAKRDGTRLVSVLDGAGWLSGNDAVVQSLLGRTVPVSRAHLPAAQGGVFVISPRP